MGNRLGSIRGPYKRTREQHDLVASIVKDPPENCVEWPYSCTTLGYGDIEVYRLGNQYGPAQFHPKATRHRMNVHRYALICSDPSVDFSKMVACHNVNPNCVSKKCFNPRHLRWGTVSENGKDHIYDTGTLRGESNPRSKLTAEQVVSIFLDPRHQIEVAQHYGISQAHVSSIKLRQVWKHVLRDL